MTNRVEVQGLVIVEPRYFIRRNDRLNICNFIVRLNHDSLRYRQIEIYCRAVGKIATYMSENIHKGDIVLVVGVLSNFWKNGLEIMVLEIERVGIDSVSIYDEILELIGDYDNEEIDET